MDALCFVRKLRLQIQDVTRSFPQSALNPEHRTGLLCSRLVSNLWHAVVTNGFFCRYSRKKALQATFANRCRANVILKMIILTILRTVLLLSACFPSRKRSCEEPERYESLRWRSEPLHRQSGKARLPDRNRSSLRTFCRWLP